MAEQEWPEFSIPAGDSGGTPAAPVVTEPGGAPPPAPAVSAQPGAPPASAPTPGTPAPDEMLPKYRFDELNTRYDLVSKQVEQLTGLLQRAMELKAAPPPQPGEPPDPRKERIRQELLDAMPDLKEALDFIQQQKADLLATIKATKEIGGVVSTQQAQEKAAWDAYAKRSLDAVHEAVSPYLLGKGKGGKDLDPFRRQSITDLYIRWVGGENGRIERYNAQDPGLRDEFLKFFVQQWVDPVRRGSSAEVARAARTVQNLPVAGGQRDVLGAAPAKPNNEDEDAVFKRGWALAQQLMNS